MKRYMAKEKDVEDWREAFESGKFPLYFSDFLFHKDGAQEREKSFKFDGELVCAEPAPPIKVQYYSTTTHGVIVALLLQKCHSNRLSQLISQFLSFTVVQARQGQLRSVLRARGAHPRQEHRLRHHRRRQLQLPHVLPRPGKVDWGHFL